MTPNATKWLWIGLTSVIAGLVGAFLFGMGGLGSTLLLLGGIGGMVSLLGFTAALIRGDRSSSASATVTEQPRLPREPTHDVEQAAGPVEQRAAPDRAPRQVVGDMEAERKQRLDPKNRPANAEVDNSHRVFDPETGRFVDG